MSDCVQATLKNETVKIKQFQTIMTLFEPRQPFYFHAIDSVFLSQASVPGCSILWVVSAHTQEHTHTHFLLVCSRVPGQRQWRTMRVSTSGAQQHFIPEWAQTHTQRRGGMSNQHGVIIYRLPHILQQRDGQRERETERLRRRTGPDTTRLSLNRCVYLTVRTQRAAPLKPSALSPPFTSPTSH